MYDPSFWAQLSLLVIDEAHLVYMWSKLFRKVYGRIGYTRARLDHRLRLLLLSYSLSRCTIQRCHESILPHPRILSLIFIATRWTEFVPSPLAKVLDASRVLGNYGSMFGP